MQTVLPSLLTASGPSTLTLEGGPHNPLAPPFDFLARSFMPLVHRMGPPVELKLRRPGFFPAGGGRFHARIEPAKRITVVANGFGRRRLVPHDEAFSARHHQCYGYPAVLTRSDSFPAGDRFRVECCCRQTMDDQHGPTKCFAFERMTDPSF